MLSGPPSLLNPFDAFDPDPRSSGKIPRNQVIVRQRIQRELQPVATHADGPDHLLVGPQIVVLIVVGENTSPSDVFRPDPGHMTSRAAYAGALSVLTGSLAQPEPVMR